MLHELAARLANAVSFLRRFRENAAKPPCDEVPMQVVTLHGQPSQLALPFSVATKALEPTVTELSLPDFSCYQRPQPEKAKRAYFRVIPEKRLNVENPWGFDGSIMAVMYERLVNRSSRAETFEAICNPKGSPATGTERIGRIFGTALKQIRETGDFDTSAYPDEVVRTIFKAVQDLRGTRVVIKSKKAKGSKRTPQKARRKSRFQVREGKSLTVENPWGFDGDEMAVLNERLLQGSSLNDTFRKLCDPGLSLGYTRIRIARITGPAVKKIRETGDFDTSVYPEVVGALYTAVTNLHGSNIVARRRGAAKRSRQKRGPTDRSLVRLKPDYRQYINNPWKLTREVIETLWYRLVLRWETSRTAEELYIEISNMASTAQSMSRRLHQGIRKIQATPDANLDAYDEKIRGIAAAALEFEGRIVLSPTDRTGRKSERAPAKRPEATKQASQKQRGEPPAPKDGVETPAVPVSRDTGPDSIPFASISKGEEKRRKERSPYPEEEPAAADEVEPTDEVRTVLPVETEAVTTPAAQRREAELEDAAAALDEELGEPPPRPTILREPATPQGTSGSWLRSDASVPEDVFRWFRGHIPRERMFLAWAHFGESRTPEEIAGLYYEGRIEAAVEWISATIPAVREALLELTEPNHLEAMAHRLWERVHQAGGDSQPAAVAPNKLPGRRVKRVDGQRNPNQATSRSCPRCSGFLLFAEDWHGASDTCLNCGYIYEFGAAAALELEREGSKDHRQRRRRPSHGKLRL